MEPSQIKELIWNIVGAVAVLSLSCIIAYIWGHADGYGRGIEEGKRRLTKISHNIEEELKKRLYAREHHNTENKRRNRRSRL